MTDGHQCIKQLVLTVEEAAKYHLDQQEANLSFVATALKNKAEDADETTTEVADVVTTDAEAEVSDETTEAEVADSDEMIVAEADVTSSKVSVQHVTLVTRAVKYHSSQQAESQSIVTIVLERTQRNRLLQKRTSK